MMYVCSTGEVFDYLVAHGRMKEKEARAKFRQVLLGLIENAGHEMYGFKYVVVAEISGRTDGWKIHSS